MALANSCSGRTARGSVPVLLAVLASFAAACGGSKAGTTYDFGPTTKDVIDVLYPSDVPDVARTDSPAFDPAALDVPCVESALRCGSLHNVEACVNQEWIFSALCGDPNICVEGQCVKPDSCTPGEVKGCYAADAQNVCNDTGFAWISRTCPDGQMCVLDGQCLVTVCHPTYGLCVDNFRFKTCKDDGSGYGDPQDCPTSLQCIGGSCHGMCESEIKVASYLGCEYWTVDLHNWDQQGIALSPPAEPIPHAVVISNPGPDVAVIKFETLDADIQAEVAAIGDLTIQPGDMKAYTMPVMSQNGTNVNNKSIRITSTHPVTATQFNPLNNVGVASNDASLLLPANAMGSEYLAIAFPTYYAPGMQGMASITYSGFVTVVAITPGETKVTFHNVRGKTVAGPPQAGYPAGIPSITFNQTRTFTLNQYDVLNLEPDIVESMTTLPWDLTGTLITATQPIAAFGGQECAVIGDSGSCPAQGTNPEGGTSSDSCCCDHLEEQLIPLYAWGKDYQAIRSHPRGDPNEAEYWLIMGGEDGVTVHTNPAIAGVDGITLDKGKFKYFYTTKDFEVTGTGKLGVAQYMIGAHCTPQFIGDPSMTVFPAVDQYRKDYAILTPDRYDENWVTIMRPIGITVKMDGSAILDAFTPVGSGAAEFGYVQVQPGVHHFESDQQFGVIAYGFSNAVSYGYPGGMNLVKPASTP